jgi:hypothetical protein
VKVWRKSATRNSRGFEFQILLPFNQRIFSRSTEVALIKVLIVTTIAVHKRKNEETRKWKIYGNGKRKKVRFYDAKLFMFRGTTKSAPLKMQIVLFSC